MRSSSVGGDDLVDSDVVVGETGEEQVSALVPCETGAADGLGVLGGVGAFHGGGLELHDELFGGEVPHADAGLGSEDEPVLLGGEEHAVDGRLNVGLSEELAVDEVPDDGEAVLATGSEVGGLGGHVEGVDLSLVSHEGVLQAHGLVVPDLDGLVPGGADDDGVLGVLVEFDAGNPVGVSVLLDGELALSHGVPNLQVFVSATAGNLSVVGGKRNSEHVSGVTNESSAGDTLLDVPESESTVPRSTQAISAI